MKFKYLFPGLIIVPAIALAQDVIKLNMSDIYFQWRPMPKGSAMCGYAIQGNHLSRENPKTEWDINIDEILTGGSRVAGRITHLTSAFAARHRNRGLTGTFGDTQTEKRAWPSSVSFCLFASRHVRKAPWSQNDAFASDVPQKTRPRKCRRIQPILDRNGNRLNHDPRVKVRVIG